MRHEKLNSVQPSIKMELGTGTEQDFSRRREPLVLILLTNDDGIYAPGLAALATELQRLGDVAIVAPATEQSGVGHSITFLSPLVCHEVFREDRHWGWAVEGSPADCVKLGVLELCERQPDLVVSGINGGLNAGINVLYSGTVAAAIEGAFFGITSVAVSLQYEEHPGFPRAAHIAAKIVEWLWGQRMDSPRLYNVNIPTVALEGEPELRIVPMDVTCYEEQFLRRKDPRGRTYYWATGELTPEPSDGETDLTAIAQGYVTLTPLQYDMTNRGALATLRQGATPPLGPDM